MTAGPVHRRASIELRRNRYNIVGEADLKEPATIRQACLNSVTSTKTGTISKIKKADKANSTLFCVAGIEVRHSAKAGIRCFSYDLGLDPASADVTNVTVDAKSTKKGVGWFKPTP